MKIFTTFAVWKYKNINRLKWQRRKENMTTKTFITIICIMAITTGCKTAEEGVVINGVKWATRNVDMPNTFAATPESYGKFYQWNRKVAWAATGKEITGWDSSIPKGTEWAKANDPSPAGWRLPTREEFESLLDEKKVSSEWTTLNGVKGYKFTDKATNNRIFFPAVIYRNGDDGHIPDVGNCGFYWSSTENEEYQTLAYHLQFFDNYVNAGGSSQFSDGYLIRCVAE